MNDVRTYGLKKCQTCGVAFEARHWAQMYCAACGVCKVLDCNKPIRSNGYCAGHAWRVKHRGEAGTAPLRAPRGDPAMRKNGRPGFSLVCEQCHETFKCVPSLAYNATGELRRKYCSRECRNAAINTHPDFTCLQCGKTIPRPYVVAQQGYAYQRKYCSRACHIAAQTDEFTYDKHGYRLVRKNGKRVPEHRDVMEKSIGRALFDHETVHHKDGNRANNSPSNLELWSSRHGKGQRVEDKITFAREFLALYGIPVPIFTASEAIAGLMGGI